MYQVPSASIYKSLIHRKQGKRGGVDRKGGEKKKNKEKFVSERGKNFL
jgi:hypothetical protein